MPLHFNSYFIIVKSIMKTIQRIGLLLIGLCLTAAFAFASGRSEQDDSARELAEQASDEQLEGIVAGELNYGEYLGYIAAPQEGDNLPAVILIHEWWGLNENIRENAQRFAAAGYVALAVDLYGGEATTSAAKAGRLALRVRNNMEEAFDNLEAAVATLAADERVDSARIASVGWCFGGGWSYQMARNNLGVSASVIYYGRFNPADDLSLMRGTIIGHFAEDDITIRVDRVREFEAQLMTLSGAHEIYIYPNTQHAFANPYQDVYNATAAEEAWDRTLTFLERELGT